MNHCATHKFRGFVFSFPVCVAFSFLAWKHWPGTHSCAELNWRGQKGLPSPLLNWGQAFSISLLTDLQVFHRCPFISLRDFLFILCLHLLSILNVFNVKYFSAFLEMTYFLFILLICRQINGFSSVRSIWNSWDISHLVMFYYLFISNILLNIFMVCSWGKFVCTCTYIHMHIHACVHVFVMFWCQGGVDSKPHTHVFGIFLFPLLSVRVCVSFHYFSCYSKIHCLGSILPLY